MPWYHDWQKDWQYWTLIAYLVALAACGVLLRFGFWWEATLCTCIVLGSHLIFSFYGASEKERIVPLWLHSQMLSVRGANLSTREREEDVDTDITTADGTVVGQRHERRVHPGLFGSGVLILPFPLFSVQRYPTTRQAFEIPCGVRPTSGATAAPEGEMLITKAGREKVPDPKSPQDNIVRVVARTHVGARLILLYQWNTRRLHDAVQTLHPPGSAEFDRQFKAVVDGESRALAANMTFVELLQSKDFERKIRQRLRQPESVFSLAGIITEDGDPGAVDFHIRDIDPPQRHRDALEGEQVAIVNASAQRHAVLGDQYAQERLAEAARYKIQQEGEGTAKARELLLQAIRGAPGDREVNLAIEALQRLQGMAQGTSNTIFYQLPSGLMERLSQAFGGQAPAAEFPGSFFQGMTADQRQQLITWLLQQTGGTP